VSTESELLAAIFAHPEEDMPRLMFADWLEEQGGESNTARAEYIRLEIALARDFPGKRWSAQRTAAQKPPTALFAKHGNEWYPDLFGRKNILRGTKGSPQMRRGFPFQIYADGDALCGVMERLLQLAPITSVEFRNCTTNTVYRVCAAPWTARLRTINFSAYDQPPTSWNALADAEHFGELEELVPYGGGFSPATAERIAAANRFPRLKRFVLAPASTAETITKLFAGPAFSGLCELSLLSRYPAIYGAAGLDALAASAPLAQLRTLYAAVHPDMEIVPRLAKGAFWRTLENLNVLCCGLGNDGIAEFARLAGPNFRKLELNSNQIGPAGIRALVESECFGSLNELVLWGNPIGDGGAKALAESPRAANLRSLDLSSCNIGAEGIKALAESSHLSGLRELALGSNALGAKEAKVLAASPHFGALEQLRMSSTSSPATKKALRERFGDRVTF
jgi:uncharacterized protein (TIGR02996 family)